MTQRGDNKNDMSKKCGLQNTLKKISHDIYYDIEKSPSNSHPLQRERIKHLLSMKLCTDQLTIYPRIGNINYIAE